MVLLATFAIAAYSQTDSTKVKKKVNYINVYGIVADSFTKAGIPDVKAAVLRQDSTQVDTMKVYESDGYSGDLGKTAAATYYYFEVDREPARYILRFTHPNYEKTYVDYEMKSVGRRRRGIEGPKVYMKKATRSFMDDDIDGGMLGEVTVKATRIQMVWKGDTLVYNADAFNVPEGSMLDGLIKQLPGVELKENGEIFVNGKKIDNLTLNGKDFFKGKNKVMLENLPYFTVKNIEVYNKQTEENKYLGINDEDKKEYTMDVILKREYNRGGSANVEAGGSPGPADGGDWRYKLKGFGLHFSDRTRAVLFGGMNNINETMSYDEYDSEYRDRTSEAGDNHFKQVGGQFVYLGPEDKINNTTEVTASWSDNRTDNRTESETYMNGASTFGRSSSQNRNKAENFELHNTFRMRDKCYIYSDAWINYKHDTNESEGNDVTTADQVMKDSINSSWYRSRSKSSQLSTGIYGDISKELKSGDDIEFNFEGNYSRQYNPETTSLNHYIYHRLGTTDHRDRRTETPNYNYYWNAELAYSYNLTKSFRLSPRIGIGTSDNHSDRHEYLRDEVDYLFDAQNSYNQRTENLNRRAGMSFNYGKDFKPAKGTKYFVVYGYVIMNFQRQKMGYESQPLTTNLTYQHALLNPYTHVYYHKQDSIAQHYFSLRYNMIPSTPSVTDLIDRPITSDPLNIFLGNPDLKLSEWHNWSASYSITHDSIDQTIRFNVDANMTHNARVQGYTYDPVTGIRTYRPENISGGNWEVRTGINWSRALGKKKFWHITNKINIGYNKSTSIALTTGSTSEELSRVGTMTVGYKPSFRFQKDKLTVSIKGDIGYRHIHRNIVLGEQPTDIWDMGYGISANYKLPWKFTIDTDLMMHSRRGYTDDEMNDNRLYWDASLTKSFKSDKWLLKLRGYDLLGQVSNIRYNINSQGRTETWTNSMRRYALLTVSYRFSQKPKSK